MCALLEIAKCNISKGPVSSKASGIISSAANDQSKASEGFQYAYRLDGLLFHSIYYTNVTPKERGKLGGKECKYRIMYWYLLFPFPDWTKFQLGKNIEWIRWHLHIFWSIYLSVARWFYIYTLIYTEIYLYYMYIFISNRRAIYLKLRYHYLFQFSNNVIPLRKMYAIKIKIIYTIM